MNSKIRRMNSRQPIEVELTWIRHGESCSNLISPIFGQYFPNINNKEIISHIENTHLSNFGISHIHSLKQQSPFYESFNPDLIVCSQLIRTIETAYLLFYDKLKSGNRNSLLSKFFISPFLSEFQKSLEMYETPHSPKQTIDRFHQFQSYLADSDLYPIKEIKLDYIRKDPRPNQNNVFKNASSINNKNWLKHFFKNPCDHDNYDLFISQILPLLIEKVREKKPRKKKIQIAVVCHGNYIERHVLKTLKYQHNANSGKYVKQKKNIVDPGIHIFYSPPKNADAYLERYILTPDTSLQRDTRVEQIFPERIEGLEFLPNGPIAKKSNEMNIKQFDKYDLFPFLFFRELGGVQFNIKNHMNVTRILKLIESKLSSNYLEGLNDNRSELWKKILGLCHIEQLVPYYKTDYNHRKNMPLVNPENSMEGGKKYVKSKIIQL